MIFASSKNVLISLDQEALYAIQGQFNIQKQYRLNKEISLVKLSPTDIEEIAETIHEKLHRCGGFILEPDDGSSLRRYVRRSFLSKLQAFTTSQRKLLFVKPSQASMRNT